MNNNKSICAIETYNIIKNLLHKENIKYSYFQGNILISFQNDIFWVCRIDINNSTITFPTTNYQEQVIGNISSTNDIIKYSQDLFDSLETAKMSYNKSILS